jgi:uncharacterized phage infection (PIP) family protein YhgE
LKKQIFREKKDLAKALKKEKMLESRRVTIEGDSREVRSRELFYYKKLEVARAGQGKMRAKLDRIKTAKAKPKPQTKCSPNKNPHGPSGSAGFSTVKLSHSEKSQSRSKVDELVAKVEAKEKKITELNQILTSETDSESTAGQKLKKTEKSTSTLQESILKTTKTISTDEKTAAALQKKIRTLESQITVQTTLRKSDLLAAQNLAKLKKKLQDIKQTITTDITKTIRERAEADKLYKEG